MIDLREKEIHKYKLNVTTAVDGAEGYSLELKLNENELSIIRDMIRIQWLYRLQILIPGEVNVFDRSGIEQYHQYANLIDHSQAWPKTSRVLPREAVVFIKQMDFFKQLEEEYNCKILIADEENLGWENIYWRLVRPGKEDFGGLHTENWFVKLGYYGSEINDDTREKVKIWISIYSSPTKNGLIVVPGSHLNKNWRWHAEERYGRPKPVIDEDVTQLDQVLLYTEPGRAVVFNYDLLHGGAENLANETRVSIEFTFLVKK